MKRRILLVAALATLLLAAGLGWFLWPGNWPRQHTNSSITLKFLRQAVENGKQVAVFRVEGAEHQLI